MKKIEVNKLKAITDSAFWKMVDRELGKTMGSKYAREKLFKLKNMKKLRIKASKEALNNIILDFEKLMVGLPELAVKESVKKTKSLEHIFDPVKNTSVEKAHYLSRVREFKRGLEQLPTTNLLKGKSSHKELEKMAQILFDSLSGKIDRYEDLLEETSTLNLILKNLYPEGPTSDLTAHAHHFIEERSFKYFQKDFELLGWMSPNDFPCITLMMEYHINSPQPGRLLSINTKDLAKLATKKQVFSLTQELIKSIPEDEMKEMKGLEDLLKRYLVYYEGQKPEGQVSVRKTMADSIKRVEKELSIRKSNRHIVKESKK